MSSLVLMAAFEEQISSLQSGESTAFSAERAISDLYDWVSLGRYRSAEAAAPLSRIAQMIDADVPGPAEVLATRLGLVIPFGPVYVFGRTGNRRKTQITQRFLDLRHNIDGKSL